MVRYHLPEDVLVEVLARLPVKSLLRFKCVSKFWRDILKDPSFITKHYLTRATSNNGSTVLTRRYHERNIYEFALMSDDRQAIKFSHLNLPFFKEEQEECDKEEDGLFDLNFAGPINGIVLVANKYDVSYLWNPATRKYKALPCSSTPSWLPRNFHRNTSVIGFGIDPITNGYKVVRIWSFTDREPERWECMYKVELLSLSADSCKPCSSSWRIIDAIPTRWPFGYQPSVYLKGKYYWCSGINAYSDGRAFITWFDMDNELFGLIELSNVHSDPEDDNYLRFCKLVVLKDSLAIIRYTHRVDNRVYDNLFYKIWIMNECDEEVSWTYYATVGPFVHDHSILGFWKGEELVVEINDTLVMIQTPSGKLISYGNSKHETVGRFYGWRMDYQFPLASYNESLVSVMGED